MMPVALYGIFCIAFAWFNHWLIDVKHWRVRHALNGMLHISVSIAIGYYTYPEWGVANLTFTRICFDTTLSLWRGLEATYVSPAPRSWVDIAEKWIFKEDGLTPKILYLVITIVLLISPYQWHKLLH